MNEKYRLKLESIKNSHNSRFAKIQNLRTLRKEQDEEMKLLFNSLYEKSI